MSDPPDAGIDPGELNRALQEAFGGADPERRTVVRAVRDLQDSGRIPEDRGHELTAGDVIENLDDAPGGGPADRWNWWMGALEAAHGGYAAFAIHRYEED